MSTIVGVQSRDAVVLAADRRHVGSGVVTSETFERVSDRGDLAWAVVGDPGDVDAFDRTLESELDEYEQGRDERTTVDVAAELAGSVADETDVQALVAGRTDDGDAGLRVVDDDGGVLEDDRAALGSGAGPAFGALDAISTDASVDDVANAVRDLLDDVAERDPETGDDVDVVTVTTD